MFERRRLVLLGLLLLTVWAAIHVSESPESAHDDVVAAAVERAPVRRQVSENATPAALALPLDKLQRDSMEVGDLNPFSARSWYVAPPPPPPPPPAEPSAPPLPFTYVGRLQEPDGRRIVYLAKGEEVYAIGKGETFDNVYRFEGVEGGNVIIQYLPMSVKQSLPIGGES